MVLHQGVGESDANPWIMREIVMSFGTHIVGLGLKQLLLGENALEIERLFKKMYAGTYMNGRRGAVSRHRPVSSDTYPPPTTTTSPDNLPMPEP